MRIAILSILGFLFFSSFADAKEFKYETVFVCGPKKLGEDESYKSLGSTRKDYYFVHTAKDGDFIILHRDIQFANFRDTFLNHLYFQNGGTFRATMREADGVAMYELINKESDYVKKINVNLESMTYFSRVTRGDRKFKPSKGVCATIEM
tara:strand:+ start:239 stop:688 length:450 start_codon:yes stop_codon:yes gene_type:complete